MAKEQFKTIHGNIFETPSWLFEGLNSEFSFTHDLACNKENMKTKTGFSHPEYNSLEEEWHKVKGWLWLNPPYSPLKPWIQKAQEESLLGAKIVLLCPPITSTRYFSEVLPSEIRHILGRVPFILNGKEMKSNTSDSMILIYGPPKVSKISYVERESFRGTSKPK